MRVSTSLLYQSGVDRMQFQQQELLKVQSQISSSQKYFSAGEAPSDWSAAMGIDQLLAQNDRFSANAKTAQNRLGLEENALSDANNIITRVRQLTIQANSGSQSDSSREAIANELYLLRDSMIAAANRDDGNGRYIFAGTNDASIPFTWNGTTGIYAGDQQVRQLQIANARTLTDGDPGSEVFQRLLNGNGTIQVAGSATNTGAISVSTADVYDPAAYANGTYTVSFNAGNYQVVDASSNVVASGAYSAGSEIRFNGVRMTFANDPADGDSFTVAPSSQQDVFSLINKLADLISAPQDTLAQKAAFHTGIQQGLSELSVAQDHILSFQTSAGIRLKNVQDAVDTLDAANVDAKSTLSSLRDLDLAEAATKLQQQLVTLQAAQASFAKVQGLSLFQYL